MDTILTCEVVIVRGAKSKPKNVFDLLEINFSIGILEFREKTLIIIVFIPKHLR